LRVPQEAEKERAHMMGIYLDTADLQAVRRASSSLPLAGVTTNPTILLKSAPTWNATEHQPFDDETFLREALAITQRPVFMQLTGSIQQMQQQAERYLTLDRNNVVLKIPANEEGVQLALWAKRQTVTIAMTAVYTLAQLYLSAAAGADFVIFYFGRMQRFGIDTEATIREMVQFIQQQHVSTQLMAASLKTRADVETVLNYGVGNITADLPVLQQLIQHPLTTDAIEAFTKDWEMFKAQLHTDLSENESRRVDP
jgi:TalC/MipB family fructose-6-phosphate aldolase